MVRICTEKYVCWRRCGSSWKKLEQFDYFENDEDDSGSDKQIDFEANFDDDDGEEFEVFVEKEKKLTKSGQQLKGLVENYEDDNKINNASETAEEEREESNPKHIKKNNELTMSDIKKAFGSGFISVKDLLKIIKLEFKLDEKEKNMIREFIHNYCSFEIDKETGEKNV